LALSLWVRPLGVAFCALSAVNDALPCRLAMAMLQRFGQDQLNLLLLGGSMLPDPSCRLCLERQTANPQQRVLHRDWGVRLGSGRRTDAISSCPFRAEDRDKARVPQRTISDACRAFWGGHAPKAADIPWTAQDLGLSWGSPGGSAKPVCYPGRTLDANRTVDVSGYRGRIEAKARLRAAPFVVCVCVVCVCVSTPVGSALQEVPPLVRGLAWAGMAARSEHSPWHCRPVRSGSL
jgi:hypothetical protein